MKLLRSQYTIALLIGVCFFIVPHETHAWFNWNDVNSWFANIAYNIVINALGIFLYFSASLLDFAINEFVIGFGNTFANTGIGIAVDNTWIIIRDFVNLFFIFGFVYIGFKLILDSANSNTRRWLVNIILAALLVNFSLFVVKFAIDMSNQLAAQIAVNGLSSTGGNTGRGGLFEVNLTAEFSARMGLSTIFNVPGGLQELPEGLSWGYVIGTGALFLTAGFVFAAGGVLLIIRFAVLCLFMVMSPIMFASWVLPPIKDTMQRFWSELFGRAMFAPIYLIFIYFSLQIISGLQKSVNGNGSSFANPKWDGAFQRVGANSGGGTVDLGTIPFFILICIFLGLSLTMASKLGMDFGDKAVSLGKSFERKVRGYASRGVTKIPRVAGGIANRTMNRSFEKRRDALALRDAQNPADMNTFLGRRQQQLRDARLRAYGAAAEASIGGAETAEQKRKRLEGDITERNKRRTKLLDEEKRKQDVAGAGITQNEGESDEDFAIRKSEVAARAIRGMSSDQLLELVRENKSQVTSPEFAAALSEAQVKALKDSGLLSGDDIETLKTNRDIGTFKNLEDILNGAGKEFGSIEEEAKALEEAFEALGKTLKGMSEDRLVGLGTKRLTDKRFAAHLSDAQIESLQKSGKYSTLDIENIKKARTEGIKNSVGTGDGANEFFGNRQAGAGVAAAASRAKKLLTGNVQEAGKLPPAIFADSDMAKHITPQALEQRMRNGDVSNEDLRKIRQNISTYLSQSGTPDSAKKAWKAWAEKSVYGAQAGIIVN